MRIVKCDKCLREWTEGSYIGGLLVTDDLSYERPRSRSYLGSVYGEPIHLCPTCARSFRNWLDEVEPDDDGSKI